MSEDCNVNAPLLENLNSHEVIMFVFGFKVVYILYIHGVSKQFGEWYQEKKKKEDTNKITVLAFKMNLLFHNTLLATFIKASGKCQERPF
jgi:hypothetical protein